METKTAAKVVAFKKFDEVFVAMRTAGTPYRVGERVNITSVSNVGTKRTPVFRYSVAGAWFDHDALSATDPLAEVQS